MGDATPETLNAVLAARLGDENEQLRTALESALEDNAQLLADRERLLQRTVVLARELKSLRITRDPSLPLEMDDERRSETEEELRVAFEELQVLTEELEVANTALQQTNAELDARVAERTGALAAVNASLRVTEASLRAIADLVPDLLWRTDRAGVFGWFNKQWYDYTGQPVAASLKSGWVVAVSEDDAASASASWDGAVASGDPFERQVRLCAASGEVRWHIIRAVPTRDEAGRITHWFGAITDIHDQHDAMEALQQSELRFRTLIEGMPQLVWRAVDGGKWTWSSPQWTKYTGLSEQESRGMGWLNALHPEDRPQVLAAWERAQTGEPLEYQARIYHAPEGRHRHFRTRAAAANGHPGPDAEWLGTSTDVDDLLQLQSRQSVLVAELQHRTRNLMSVVQSITMRTIRDSTSLEAFHRTIGDRLGALARVQGLLSRRGEATRVSFDALIREELSAHVRLDAEGRSAQVTAQGPTGIGLRSANVQTLALAIHELATNAVKYGALATPEGHLAVNWAVDTDGEPPKLRVDWRESKVSNMPQVGAGPIGSGYGRELIERALPFQLGARTRYQFAPDGVHCSIEIPIPQEEAAKEAHDA